MDLNQPPQPIPPVQPRIEYAPPASNSSMSILKIFLIIVVTAILSSAATFVLVKSQSQTPPVATLTPTNVPSSPTPTPDETANWKTYHISQFGMEFKIPPQLSSYGDLQEQVQVVPPPFSGKVFCMTFSKQFSTDLICKGDTFAIGVISKDYNVERGGTFLDLNGFVFKNGRYYYTHGDGSYPSEDVTKVNNTHGVGIIKLKYHQPASKPQEEFMPPPYSFGDESAVGALINTHDAIFSGFAVKMNLVNGLTEEDFDKILSTFKFIDQSVSTTPVNAEGKPCGGIAGETGNNACPTGYVCKYPQPVQPDGQGQCVKQ